MRRHMTIAAALVATAMFVPRGASATIRYGGLQLSGNLESQQLFRIDQGKDDTFDAFNLVQQRNTFRLQYEQELVKGGEFLGGAHVPGVKLANFFAYYRFVYDSVYDIEPGPFLKASDGSRGGGFGSFTNRERHALAFENRLREVFLDLELQKIFGSVPVSFRIGRQQIVWGNTVNFRALDSVNALDLTWHMQQEAGILGKVGFSELRIPSWAFKMLVSLPSAGPVSNSYFEAFDIPFEFEPTRLRFVPRPWSMSLRQPFRGGVTTAVGPSALQLCFDTTGSRAPSDDDGIPLTPSNTVDFSDAARTGLCPTKGLQQSTFNDGIYDKHDPRDVNQFGFRYGGTVTDLGLGFSLVYKYQRHLIDATGGTISKSFAGLVNSNPVPFIEIAPHATTDPDTGVTTQTLGYARIPIEFYYPYVSTFGASFDYFDEFTAAVYNLEIAANKGVPIANGNPAPDFPGMRRAWEMEIALLADRPTWIRFLNPRSTFTTLVQGNLSVVPDRQKVTFGPNPFDSVPPQGMGTLSGDLGAPNSNAVPGLFRDEATLDQRHKFEYLTIVALSTFYRGGSIAPLFVWVGEWDVTPSMEWQFFVQYLPTPSVILEPGFRIFWTNGRTVDDRYSVGRMTGRSEAQLKMTVQF